MNAQARVQKKRVSGLIISLFVLLFLSSLAYGEQPDSGAPESGVLLHDSGSFRFLDVMNMDANGNPLIWDPSNEKMVKLNHLDGSTIWEAECRIGSSPYIDNVIDSRGNVVLGGTLFDDVHHFLRKYDDKNGVLLWEIINPVYYSPTPEIYLDHSGNVFSSGTDGVTNYIAKYSADSGAVIWKHNRGLLDTHILRVNSGGNIIAYDLDSTNNLCHVSKYNGKNGAVMWQNTQQAYLGGITYERMAIDVHFDKIGNLYLTGANLPNGSTRFISKYNGVTGALIWEKSVLGDTIDFDSNGNAIVFRSVNDTTLSITRYNGATGKVMWESTHGIFSWGNFKHIFDSRGNVMVVGSANDIAVSITKYNGVTGRILWEIIPTFRTNRDLVTLDSAGDLIVEGTAGGDTVSLAKYKGSTGILLWEKTHGLPANNSLTDAGAGLDSEGNVLIQGQVNDTTMFISKYNGSTGSVMWEVTHSGSHTDIHFDKNGSIFVAGFNSGSITRNDSLSGTLIWEKTFWSPDPDPIIE